MRLTLALLFLLVLAVVLFLLWGSGLFNKGQSLTDLINLPKPTTAPILPDVLGQTQEILDNSLNDAKSTVSENIELTGQNVAAAVQGQTRNIANSLSPTQTQVIVLPSSDPNSSNLPSTYIFNLDYSSSSPFNIKFVRNQKYYLKFSNLPENSCLVVDSSSYPIASNQTISLLFATSGARRISITSCPSTPKNIGIIEVE